MALAWWVQALLSRKARRILAGRRRWREHLAGVPARQPGVPRVHFHAASVGEFEQAKPIIEYLRRAYPQCCITASFFSSSGYEQQHAYPLLDGACYMPHDTPGEMRDFLGRLDPDAVVIIRYDLWPEFTYQAHLRALPMFLACGVMRRDALRFHPLWRRFFAGMYGRLAHVFAVSAADRDAFLKLAPGLDVTVSGDTRYDRVIERTRADVDLGVLRRELFAGRTVVVAGSTWPQDEDVLQDLGERDDIALVIVPHEPSERHVNNIRAWFPGSLALSELGKDAAGIPAPRTVIVDRTGILSGLYRMGDIAYVGGAFGEGVHSVLEPAAYGMPVICGPGITRSRDAEEMRDAGILQTIETRAEMTALVERLLRDPEERRRLGDAAGRFVAERAGATEHIGKTIAAVVR